MNKTILVTYASKYGATAEIATKIGEVLSQSRLNAEVLPVKNVRDLAAYQAVILGSALYIGKWNKNAEAFLKANVKTLAERPVWLFSSGPTGRGDPLALLDGQRLPPGLQPVADRIRPRDIAVFHGLIDPGKVNFIEKWAVKSVVKKPMGDFRDWDMIARWAGDVAAELSEADGMKP
jgi:menaquinone-dependent protoporphyrinogen oxidase